MVENPLLLILSLLFAISSAVLAFYVFRLRSRSTLFDDLPDAILTVDRSGRVTQANKSAISVFNTTEEAVNGRSIIELLPVVEPLLLDNPKEEPERIEVILGEGEGGSNTYDVKVIVCQNERGENTGWLVTLNDITRPKQIGLDLLRQKQQYERLLTVARAMTEQPTVEETLQNALDVTTALTDAEYGSVFILDENGVVTQGILSMGKMVPGQEHIVRRVLDFGLAGWVVEHKKTALIDDTSEDDRWFQSPSDGYEARSALVAPILNQQTVLGILTLTHSLPYHFQEEDAFLIAAAGEQMALAVRNAQLYDEQRALASRQTTLFEVLRTVGGHLDPDDVVEKATEIITQLTGWPALAILTPNGVENELVVNAATGFLEEWIGRSVSTDASLTGKAFREGVIQFQTDIEETGRTEDGWPPPIAAQLAVPMRRGENILGVLEVQSKTPYVIMEKEMELAMSLAEATALALDNARYNGAVRKHAADLNALYTVNRMIGRSLGLDELLAKSLYSALTSMGFGFGFIGLVDPQTKRLSIVSQRGMPVDLTMQLPNGSMAGEFGTYVYQQSQGVVIDGLEVETPELVALNEALPNLVDLLKQLKVSSVVGVPLDHQRESVGVLCMFSRKLHHYTTNDLALQVTIGQQIGMAVSNSRLFTAVSQERSLLQALIDSSNDGLVLVGPNGMMLVVNHTALDFFQMPGTPDDWINRPIMAALSTLRRSAPKLVRLILDEMRLNVKVLNRSSDGEIEIFSRSILWQNLPVWSGETFLGRLLVLHDMTDERELNQVREDLVHTMVHDLRNPLTSIFGSLEFLGDQIGATLSPEFQQVLEIAQSNARHMVGMVSAILELNRLESGQMPIDQKPIFLPDLIDSVVKSQFVLASSKNIIVDVDFADGLPLAWADGNLFERVLQNLLDNAIRFSPPDNRIVMRASLETGSDWLLVSVIDSGPGVPKDVQERIFQKFTTARHEASRTGLGLTFCKMVVEAHGGRIWIENNADQGATFYFTAPPLPATV